MRNRLAKHPGFAATGLAEEFSRQPLSFIDIGARDGTHPLVEPIASVTGVLGFEPDPDECQRLLSDRSIVGPWASFDLEPIALSNKSGEVALHLAAVATNHSLLPGNPSFVRRYGMVKFEGRGSTTVTATTMDDVLFDRRAREPHLGEFIKIDTQGSEWEILAGASRCLAERCVAVYAEVWFCEVYAGVKQFSEVELLLRDHGFSFYGFSSWHSRSRRQMDKRFEIGRERALYADAVFLKDPLPGGPRAVHLSDRRSRVLFVCALLLGYPDLALELIASIWPNDPVRAEAARQLVHAQAAADPAAAERELTELLERIRKAPDRALVEAGKFADGRRLYWDYDDL